MAFLAVAMIASAAVSAISQYSASEAEKEAHERNAVDLEVQAKLAEIDAEKEAAIYERETNQQIGMIAGEVQSSGFDFSGSDYQLLTESLDNQAANILDIREQGSRDAENIRRGGERSRALGRAIIKTRGLRAISGGLAVASAGIRGKALEGKGA